MKYVKGFDTIRALAIIIVIIGHWGLPFAAGNVVNSIVDPFIQYGRFGVTIFFVLSGFLITSILLNEKINNTAADRFNVVKKFFARRVLRIFPIYYLFLLLIFIANDPFIRSHIWYYVFYSSNLLRGIDEKSLPHFWSLAVEEQFYLIWPWLILFINIKYVRNVFIFFIITGVVSQYYSFNVAHVPYGLLSINCFDSFGIGATYAYIRLDKEKCRKFEQSFRVVFPFLLFLAWKLAPITGTPIGVIYLRVLDNIIALALIIFAINTQTGWVKKYVLENRLFNFIGKISYGIYLYHYTFGFAFFRFVNYIDARMPLASKIFSHEYIFYFTKLGCLIVISWLSYRFIEQPILGLKKYFNYSRQAETAG